VHLNIADDSAAVELSHVLETYGLTQHISQPTHVSGHTLNVFITRSDQVTEAVNVDVPLLCDHSLVAVSVDLYTSHKSTPSVGILAITIDVDVFVKDLLQSTLVLAPPYDDDDLFQCYNDTLWSLLDADVLLRMVSRRSGGHSARGYDAECRTEKAKTRRLERLYRRSPTSEAWSR